MLLKAKAKRLGATLTDIKAKALLERLAYSLLEPVNGKHCDLLGDVKFWALSNTYAYTLVDEVVETIGDRVVNVHAEHLAKVRCSLWPQL